jgi:hypothetical protein
MTLIGFKDFYLNQSEYEGFFDDNHLQLHVFADALLYFIEMNFIYEFNC